MYDAIIVGGSFAGLAAAQELRGRHVLLIDQRPIGSHQTSTCGLPQATARRVGAAAACLEVHDTIVLHTGGHATAFALPEPYMTFDYSQFCQAMLAQCDAEVQITRATGATARQVETARGPVEGRFVVDASGWQTLARSPAQRDQQVVGYGVETELPVRLDLPPGLHLYYEKRITRDGYGWVFPCGATSRIGVCTFEKGVRLGPILAAFLERWGLQPGVTHGGVMATRCGPTVADGVLRVGDAAGQCLPLTAEGIRSAIYYSAQAGRAIAAALDGTCTDDEARARYAAVTRPGQRFQRAMALLQAAIRVAPEWTRAGAGRLASWPPWTRYMVRGYLRCGGWL